MAGCARSLRLLVWCADKVLVTNNSVVVVWRLHGARAPPPQPHALEPQGSAKIEEVTLMRPFHGNV